MDDVNKESILSLFIFVNQSRKHVFGCFESVEELFWFPSNVFEGKE